MSLYQPAQSQDLSETFSIDAGYKFIDPEPNSLTMYAGGIEMMRVSQDGFYIRGVKVPADEKEAETVYKAFKEFLVWAELNRR